VRLCSRESADKHCTDSLVAGLAEKEHDRTNDTLRAFLSILVGEVLWLWVSLVASLGVGSKASDCSRDQGLLFPPVLLPVLRILFPSTW
jgi:hypothetical protein